MTRLTCVFRWLQPIALLAAAVLAVPAQADVDLRVVARPVSDPLKALVKVTNDAGVPILSLVPGDFTVTLDGAALSTFTFALPPALDDTQRVSVIFAMDYSTSVTNIALDAMQDAVQNFIEQMELGDYAAIVKFNETAGVTLVQPFTEFDGVSGTGTGQLIAQLMAPYPGDGTNLFDAIDLAVDTFLNPGVTLPIGPKAVILISDGGENASVVSQSDAVAHANENSVSIFTIGVGNIANIPVRDELMNALAESTGGSYIPAPDDQAISDAYVTIALSLNNEYLLTIPSSPALNACDVQHTLEIAVQGQAAPANLTFTRCDATPDNFDFTNETGVAPSSVVVSDTVTIVGIDTAVPISITGGEYSIGCGATFTSAAGTIDFEDEVCVRHTSSASFSTVTRTTLIVGGVSSEFTSTTRASAPPSGSGGGGGATGVLELLLGLSLLFGSRRRLA